MEPSPSSRRQTCAVLTMSCGTRIAEPRRIRTSSKWRHVSRLRPCRSGSPRRHCVGGPGSSCRSTAHMRPYPRRGHRSAFRCHLCTDHSHDSWDSLRDHGGSGRGAPRCECDHVRQHRDSAEDDAGRRASRTFGSREARSARWSTALRPRHPVLKNRRLRPRAIDRGQVASQGERRSDEPSASSSEFTVRLCVTRATQARPDRRTGPSALLNSSPQSAAWAGTCRRWRSGWRCRR